VTAGEARLGGKNLFALPEREMLKVRGGEIAMIFQEPMTSLNPVMTIGAQLVEALRAHRDLSAAAARQETIDILGAVRISDAARRFRQYPHELSGGMRQRVMIAMALCGDPKVLIADEPTTALDVTIQAEILDLLEEMKKKFHLALMLITHDLGVVAGHADRVAVMYAGRIVEEGPMRQIFDSAKHPYTQGLLESIPGRPAQRGGRVGSPVGGPGGAPGQRLRAIEGSVPNLAKLPSGCAFEPRCPHRFDLCPTAPPPPYDVGPDQRARCYLYDPRRS
jgi:oligopeptide/dipeptide ABC transporter ATP-binding protein